MFDSKQEKKTNTPGTFGIIGINTKKKPVIMSMIILNLSKVITRNVVIIIITRSSLSLLAFSCFLHLFCIYKEVKLTATFESSRLDMIIKIDTPKKTTINEKIY